MSTDFPSDLCVFERGWLSSNSLLMLGEHATLIDSGHVSHAQQLQALLAHHLGAQNLCTLLNTHLHSDHCGGNAHLKLRYPALNIAIPPGQWTQVHDWPLMQELHAGIGQVCEPFTAQEQLHPGSELCIHGRTWEIHAAPGHDHDAVVLYAPLERILVSGDAFWENGFGVVFAELEKESGFQEVRQTLELIERLNPRWVIPGHGRMFTHVNACLKAAYSKLDYFETKPLSHAKYAAKVFIKFKLMLIEHMSVEDLLIWAKGCKTLLKTHMNYFQDLEFDAWLLSLMRELERSKSLDWQEGRWFNR